jgi:hypothetical protein
MECLLNASSSGSLGTMHLGWIWTDNLRPMVFEIALLVGYEFDDPDWIAVEHGMGELTARPVLGVSIKSLTSWLQLPSSLARTRWCR